MFVAEGSVSPFYRSSRSSYFLYQANNRNLTLLRRTLVLQQEIEQVYYQLIPNGSILEWAGLADVSVNLYCFPAFVPIQVEILFFRGIA